MTEERTLVANLVPHVEDSDLAGFKEQLSKALSTDLNIDVDLSNPEGTDTVSEEVKEEVKEANKTLNDVLREFQDRNAEEEKEQNPIITNVEEQKSKGMFSGLKDTLSDAFGKKGEVLEAIQGVASVAGTAGLAVTGAVRVGFGMIEKVINYLKGRSPFLRSIIEMFENVLNILLGPLFTAIGIEMIPLLEKVYDKLMKAVEAIWEAYEEDGLKGIMRETIKQGFDLLTDAEIWGTLSDMLKTIMTELINGAGEAFFGPNTWKALNDFLGTPEDVITGLSDMVDEMSYHKDDSNLKKFQMSTTANPVEKMVYGLTHLWSILTEGLAEGGVVEPVPGGTVKRLAEAGEREYVIPESKVESFVEANSTIGGSITYIINVSGYTDTDLTDKIVSVINRQTDMSRLQAGGI